MFYLCICTFITCMQYPQRSEDGSGFPETRGTDRLSSHGMLRNKPGSSTIVESSLNHRFISLALTSYFKLINFGDYLRTIYHAY